MLAPVVHRLSLIIRKRSKKKEMREQLKQALSAAEDLEKAQDEMIRIGKEFERLLDGAKTPVPPGYADKLYTTSGKWMAANANIMLGMVKLAQQAQILSHFKPFMDDLRHLFPSVYAFVMMMDRSYKEGKLEMTEFPTFIALYGPKGMDEAADIVKAEMDKYEAKLSAIAETMPEPFRHRVPVLRRSYQEMMKARGGIATTNESIIQALLARAPPWMRTLSEIAEKSVQRAAQIALKRANRYTPRKFPPQPGKWPSGKTKGR